MKNVVDWSQAPHEILELIAERLNSIEDYVRFGGVCRSWRFVTLDQHRLNFSPKTLPWLMFPLEEKDELEDGSYIENPDFFSLSEDKYYKFDLPEARSCCITGSPYGWLILFAGERIEIYNPLTRVRITLPLPFEDKERNFYRFAHLVMPSSTTSPKCQFIVVVNFVDSLAFIRAGDLAWTTIEISNIDNDDMVYLNNVFYIVDSDGVIRHFDVTSPNPVATEFVQPPDELKMEDITFHLVELLGELHMVVKYDDFQMLSVDHHFVIGSRAFDENRAYYFRVFKLDFSTKKWKELDTLGDYTFFVGRNTSFSIRASDFSHCSRGGIYFTDTLNGGGRATGDIGIFDIETDGMEVLFTGEDDVNLYAFPVWFIPSLC
ncbi:hypothetical protein ACHQM5_028719 [Ranunculus cassubicifolius]